MDKIELGKRLREAREQKGYTQEQLAEIADVGVMYLGEIERGQKMPSMKIFIKVVEALDVSADYILRYELSTGKEHVRDEFTHLLEGLTPQQRRAAFEILSAYVHTL